MAKRQTTSSRSKKTTISKKGKKPITFNKGALHRALSVPEGETIPASKMRAALAGRYGPKVKKMAVMAKGVLAKGRRTAARKSK
jgi:hypothetical protein